MDTLKKFLKDKKAIALVIGYLITIMGYEFINKLNLSSINLTTAIDNYIPLIKVFVIPYYLWYPLVVFSFIYIYHKDEEEFYKFGTCIVATMAIALIIFFFFQTSVVRPTIYGNDIFSNLINGIYIKDRPVNCCPSLHCAITLICVFYVGRVSENEYLKHSVNLLGLLIILSTIFIKQHVVFDVIAAFILVHFVRIFVENRVEEYKEGNLV